MPEMEINIMKVLIFTTRQLCYNSGYYFAHRIGEEIENLGLSVNIAKYLRMQSHQQEHRLHSQL